MYLVQFGHPARTRSGGPEGARLQAASGSGLLLPMALSVALVLSTLGSQRCLAQGALNPPGPPGPAFKTLSQIEPRTPISSLPVTITQPGSYYLTGTFDLGAGQDGIFNVAFSSYGLSSSGTGISAFIASICHGETIGGTALSTSHNVNSY